MGDLYSKRRTIVDDMNDLNTFKRKPNEPIHTAMQRAKIAAERVRHLWPATIWNANKKLEILLSILRQIISPETKRHLEYEEMKYMKTGTMLEYNAMLDMVETFEMTRDQMPRAEKHLIINVCTGTPKLVEQDTIISDQVRTLKIYSGTIRGRKGEALRETLHHLDQTLRVNGVEPMEMGTKTIPTDIPPASTFNKKRKLGDEGTFRDRNEKPRNTERFASREYIPPRKISEGDTTFATQRNEPHIPNQKRFQQNYSESIARENKDTPNQTKESKEENKDPLEPDSYDSTKVNEYRKKSYSDYNKPNQQYNNYRGGYRGSYQRNYPNNYRGGYYNNQRGNYGRGRGGYNYTRGGYVYRGNYRYRGGYDNQYNRSGYNYDNYQRNNAPPNDNNRYKTIGLSDDKNTKVVAIAARCPDCKKMHHINTCCPVSGNKITLEQPLN